MIICKKKYFAQVNLCSAVKNWEQIHVSAAEWLDENIILIADKKGYYPKMLSVGCSYYFYDNQKVS